MINPTGSAIDLRNCQFETRIGLANGFYQLLAVSIRIREPFAVYVGGSSPWQYLNAAKHNINIINDTDTDTFAICSAPTDMYNTARSLEKALNLKSNTVLSSNEFVSLKYSGNDYNVILEHEVLCNFNILVALDGSILYDKKNNRHKDDFHKFIFDHEIICYKLSELIGLASKYEYSETKRVNENASPPLTAFKKLAFVLKSLEKPFMHQKVISSETAKYFNDHLFNEDNKALVDNLIHFMSKKYREIFRSQYHVEHHIDAIRKKTKEALGNNNFSEKSESLDDSTLKQLKDMQEKMDEMQVKMKEMEKKNKELSGEQKRANAAEVKLSEVRKKLSALEEQVRSKDVELDKRADMISELTENSERYKEREKNLTETISNLQTRMDKIVVKADMMEKPNGSNAAAPEKDKSIMDKEEQNTKKRKKSKNNKKPEHKISSASSSTLIEMTALASEAEDSMIAVSSFIASMLKAFSKNQHADTLVSIKTNDFNEIVNKVLSNHKNKEAIALDEKILKSMFTMLESNSLPTVSREDALTLLGKLPFQPNRSDAERVKDFISFNIKLIALLKCPVVLNKIGDSVLHMITSSSVHFRTVLSVSTNRIYTPSGPTFVKMPVNNQVRWIPTKESFYISWSCEFTCAIKDIDKLRIAFINIRKGFSYNDLPHMCNEYFQAAHYCSDVYPDKKISPDHYIFTRLSPLLDPEYLLKWINENSPNQKAILVQEQVRLALKDIREINLFQLPSSQLSDDTSLRNDFVFLIKTYTNFLLADTEHMKKQGSKNMVHALLSTGNSLFAEPKFPTSESRQTVMMRHGPELSWKNSTDRVAEAAQIALLEKELHREFEHLLTPSFKHNNSNTI